MKEQGKNIRDILEALEGVKEQDFRYFGKHNRLIPSRKAVIRIVKMIQSLMFPDYLHHDGVHSAEADKFDEIYSAVRGQIRSAYSFFGEADKVDADDLTLELLSEIPAIKSALIKDAVAIYEGDPAARSPEEVILCYPGFYAISIYRIAHEFYKRNIPYISRLMTEFAHEKTGVDIHAGATIGEYFCIDHGTGIVIGETATIGDRVKIYQGVTLGAKSFEVGEDGNPIKGIKRHPDIGNGCVIYANATILGGNTKIGDGSVIGGNVWITSSVAPGTVVHYGRNAASKKGE